MGPIRLKSALFPRVRLRERVFTSPLLPAPAPRDHFLHFEGIPSLSNRSPFPETQPF
jgi:hypothetical protein